MSIVETARAVLEQELRASPLAPPQLQAPRPSVDCTPRRRLHAALDVLLDALARLSASTPATPTTAAGDAQLPLLAAARPAHAGAEVEIRTTLANDGPTPVEVSLVATDLVAGPEARIPADCVQPSPATALVDAGRRLPLVVRITVPGGTPAGCYLGLLRATRLDELRALLAVSVE